ncbi:MAG: MFS transporter [Rhodospirillales bacterium]|nr:MAG: MFS transporter [Rhodospirillales bacterium]
MTPLLPSGYNQPGKPGKRGDGHDRTNRPGGTSVAAGGNVSSLTESRALLADAGFRRLWLIGAVTSVMRWLDMLTAGIFVFDVTGSPGMVAAVTLLRLVPMVAGAYAGTLVERLPLRRVLRFGLVALAILYAILAALGVAGLLTVWQVALGVLLVGVYWALDGSVRRTLLSDVAGVARTGPAIALDWSTINATRAIGPLAGGAVYAALGVGACYALGVACFGLALAMAARLDVGGTAAVTERRHVWAAIRDGFRIAWASPMLLGTLAVTTTLNFFGFPYSSMLPVVGKEVLHASPAGVGLLSSAEGFGAFVASLALAGLARPSWFARAYLLGSFGVAIGALVLGLSTDYALSLLAMLFAGFGMALFATMQSTLILTHAPADSRSRLMGVLTTCIGVGQLGIAHIGVLAASFGAATAIVVSEVEAVVVPALCVWRWPALWRDRR